MKLFCSIKRIMKQPSNHPRPTQRGTALDAAYGSAGIVAEGGVDVQYKPMHRRRGPEEKPWNEPLGFEKTASAANAAGRERKSASTPRPEKAICAPKPKTKIDFK